MTSNFPKLPTYQFSWRSLQLEPIPHSGERITLGAIVKGYDGGLIAAKLVSTPRLRKFYGNNFGDRISSAVSICVSAAETFYSNNPLSNEWEPPLEGFFSGQIRSSVAVNIEEGLFRAAIQCSSFCASLEAEKLEISQKHDISAPESWRKNILDAVTTRRAEFAEYFDRTVPLRGSGGVPFKFGFLSANYAAQFDAVSDSKGFQQGLIRAQSKLWQLDRLRDESTLFQPDTCELLLRVPLPEDVESSESLTEFIEELKYEASRRELSIYTGNSVDDAATHLIKRVA